MGSKIFTRTNDRASSRYCPCLWATMILLGFSFASGGCHKYESNAFVHGLKPIGARRSCIGNIQILPTSSLSTAANTASSLSAVNSDEDVVTEKIPWLIVGGGIHGVHVSARLIGSSVVSSAQDIRIIDSHSSLLRSWKVRTKSTGMKFLRSSGGYHLDLPEDSLRRFSLNGNTVDSKTAVGVINQKTKCKQRRKKHKISQHQKRLSGHRVFSNDYERPRLDFFNDHCDSVVSKYGLEKIHTKGTVKNIEPSIDDDYVKVQVLRKKADDPDVEVLIEYHASNVVLALGNDRPSYPDWVDMDYDVIQHGFVRHLLDTDYGGFSRMGGIAVVGGGITAAHKALELISKSNGNDECPKGVDRNVPSTSRTVHVIARHPLKEQQFDTHQEWMMDKAAAKRSEEGGGSGLPERQVTFQECDCYKMRRKIIAQERIPGTVTPAVHRGEDGLKYAIQKGDVQWHQAEIVDKAYVMRKDDGVDGEEVQQLELTLSCGETIQVDQVLLGTGFGRKVPGGALIQDLSRKLDVSEFCGYPIVDENLRWGNAGIYVTGALAELELGPSARNIAGARLAAERIVHAFNRAT